MSRMTAAQVIAQGDYLKPDFEPSSLTVPQLLGVLGFHNIKYPSQYTKPKLVQIFNEEIKPKAKKFIKERLKRENSQASEDGITDGVTGRPLKESKPVRRSSRRLSKTPVPNEQPEVESSAPPKRRRATAEPSLGGPSRRRTAQLTEPTLVEESEPEEEPVVRKVRRPKKAAADAGTQARRVSRPIAEDPESGWEDNNIFQSGTESSPLRPSPVRPRPRKSSVGARTQQKSRKSMSAPPQISSPSPPKDKGKGRELSPVKPPESSFEPQLPAAVFQGRQLSVVRDLKEEDEDEEPPWEPTQPIASLAESMAEAGVHVPTDEAEDMLDDEKATELQDESVDLIAQRIAEGGSFVNGTPSETPRANWFLRLLVALLLFTSTGLVVQYKQENAQIGFCDAGSSTNSILNDLRERRAVVESCNRENRTTLYTADPAHTSSPSPPLPTKTGVVDANVSSVVPAETCPPLPLVPAMQPDECTPCPRHATCTPDSLACENGYVLKPHPLLAFLPVPLIRKETANGVVQAYEREAHVSSGSPLSDLLYAGIHYAFDGMPYIGPVAVPPRCVEDPRRKRHIGALGNAIESILANERGRRICEGLNVGLPEGDEATESQRWGLELEKLREHIKKTTRPSMLDALDDTFNEAVRQLLQWGGVFMGEDATGKRFLAHKTAVMSWQCAVRVKVRELWNEWRLSIIGAVLSILVVMLVRRRQAQRAVEGEQVATLVTVALDCLRNQELAHHTDPVTVTRPYLSSLQLRDLVLQDIHDVSKRKRLWSRVERVVEGNANVRTNLQEVDGGDEQRVWEWVGSSGKMLPPGSPGIQRLDFGEGGRIVA
ncbi:Man1-Src1p-C-terminal domain-containing protein [Ganoderma leucocontextum]|nr:Man1-Src1p-C-terminal domain-containing protein [Ganoderma leucocontextum]